MCVYIYVLYVLYIYIYIYIYGPAARSQREIKGEKGWHHYNPYGDLTIISPTRLSEKLLDW